MKRCTSLQSLISWRNVTLKKLSFLKRYGSDLICLYRRPKVSQRLVDGGGSFYGGKVACVFYGQKTGVGKPVYQFLRPLRRCDPVLFADDDQSGNGDLRQSGEQIVAGEDGFGGPVHPFAVAGQKILPVFGNGFLPVSATP